MDKIHEFCPIIKWKFGLDFGGHYKESFYQKLKFELEDFNSYKSQGELIEAIALQIYYYNNKRIHLALKMPPAVFHKRFTEKNN